MRPKVASSIGSLPRLARFASSWAPLAAYTNRAADVHCAPCEIGPRGSSWSSTARPRACQDAKGAQTMLMRVLSRAAICMFAIFSVVLPAYGLTSEEVIAKIEAGGHPRAREMTAGKIITYKAVRAGNVFSLVSDSFGR